VVISQSFEARLIGKQVTRKILEKYKHKVFKQDTEEV